SFAAIMGIAFLVFAGLKFLLDVIEAGAATTAPELEQKKEAIGQDVTLAALVGLTAGIVKLVKVTVVRFRGAATDPAKADPNALKEAAKEADKSKAGAEQQAKEMQEKGGEAKEQKPGETPAGMSEPLKQIRASLQDPDAVNQFDKMFEKLGDSAKMEKALADMQKEGNLEKRLGDEWRQKNQVPRGDALAEVPEVKAQAESLLKEAEAYRAANPSVKGVTDISKALTTVIKELRKMEKGGTVANKEVIEGYRRTIEGAEDNLRVAQGSSGVTHVGAKFPLNGKPKAVDVDVVADQGRTWIEVKRSKETFSLKSDRWLGKASKRGLKEQAQRLLEAAEQNKVDGQAPKVVLHFTQGVSRAVAEALRAMGIEVRGEIIDLAPEVPSTLPTNPEEEKNKEKKR
ncbi:MAG TPA: hypothetical protein VD861_03830, partial [Pyrinomonadaceae bacterium]|nr:hypothetical protein [Pyrinomonadaceae bacterium]